MLPITLRLEEMLKEGAVLFTPNSRYPLAYAWPDLNWSSLLLLYIDNGQLKERRIAPQAADYDEQTQKLYAAYSKKDYIQIRPGQQAAEQRSIRMDCLQLQREALGISPQTMNCILKAILHKDWPASASVDLQKGALQSMNLHQLGATLLLMNKWSRNEEKWRQWFNASFADSSIAPLVSSQKSGP